MSNLGNHFELNTKTVGELLKSEEMRQALMNAAQQVAATAGDGYKAKIMSTRVVVFPDTAQAAQDNLENNTLLKSGWSR